MFFNEINNQEEFEVADNIWGTKDGRELFIIIMTNNLRGLLCIKRNF